MKIRYFIPFFIALTLIMAIPLISGNYNSVRCGTFLVSVGSPRYEVIKKCGTPNDVQISIVERKIRNKNYDPWIRSHHYDEYGHYVTYPEQSRFLIITVEREQFIYNFGSNRFIHVLSFEDGILVDIETGEYGNE